MTARRRREGRDGASGVRPAPETLDRVGPRLDGGVAIVVDFGLPEIGPAFVSGLDAARIDRVQGTGSTTTFAAGHTPGQQRANRRAVVTFVRTATTGIVD
jgi:hypothetical protein